MLNSISLSNSGTLEQRSRFPLWIVAAITYALMTVMLWLLSGLNVAEFSDSWVIYNEIERGLPLINLHDSRLFYAIGYYIPYILTPDSFVGANLFIMVLMWGKSYALYVILRQLLPQHSLIAFFAGALYLVFPADTGTFWIAGMNVNFPILMYLLAVCVLLWYWRKPRLLKLIIMWLFLALAFTYEATYPLILVTPLSLVWLEKRLSKRVLWVSALWFVIPIIMVSRLVILYVQGSGAFGYQQAVFQTGMSGDNPLRNMLNSLTRVYERNTAFVWVESVEQIRENFDSLFALVSASAAGIAIVAGWLHAKYSDEHLHIRLSILLIITGLAIIGLGFAPYLPTEYRDTNYRVLFLSAAGGSVFLVAILYLIAYLPQTSRRILFILAMSSVFALSSRLPILVALIGGSACMILPRRILYVLAAGLMVFIGTFALLRQHQLYADMPLRQQWIMEAILRQSPSITEDAFIVLLDETSDLRGFHAFESRRDVLIGALAFLYEQPNLRAAFCAPQRDKWGFFNEHCAFHEDGLRVSWIRGEDNIPYSQLIVFRYSDQVAAELLMELPSELIPERVTGIYSPSVLIDNSISLPSRLYTMFASVPFEEQPTQIDFGILR